MCTRGTYRPASMRQPAGGNRDKSLRIHGCPKVRPCADAANRDRCRDAVPSHCVESALKISFSCLCLSYKLLRLDLFTSRTTGLRTRLFAAAHWRGATMLYTACVVMGDCTNEVQDDGPDERPVKPVHRKETWRNKSRRQ